MDGKTNFFEAPTGTGIVEKKSQNHRRMAARSGGESPLEADLTDPDPPHILRQT